MIRFLNHEYLLGLLIKSSGSRNSVSAFTYSLVWYVFTEVPVDEYRMHNQDIKY